MARQNAKSVQDELDKQDKENYGDNTISGHAPDPGSDDNAKKPLQSFIGNDPAETEDDEESGLNIAEEIEDDERAIQDKSSPTEIQSETEEELED